MGATPGANKERKAKLVKDKEINCGHCKYHRGENRDSWQKSRPDKYKSKRKGRA